jgi:hypothetical protein
VSQRDSGYERKERDLYETPEWVTLALVPHLPAPGVRFLEPAAGSGKMARALRGAGYLVDAFDIADGQDFLEMGGLTADTAGIITNPPYVQAQEFIEHAISLTCSKGLVAMLLRTDFDHAKTRAHLFSMSPRFAKKVVLRRRIKWFEDSTGSPSFNHAWFIWDWKHIGPPIIAWAA